MKDSLWPDNKLDELLESLETYADPAVRDAESAIKELRARLDQFTGGIFLKEVDLEREIAEGLYLCILETEDWMVEPRKPQVAEFACGQWWANGKILRAYGSLPGGKE